MVPKAYISIDNTNLVRINGLNWKELVHKHGNLTTVKQSLSGILEENNYTKLSRVLTIFDRRLSNHLTYAYQHDTR